MRFQTYASSLSSLILLTVVTLAQVPPPAPPPSNVTAPAAATTGKRGAITGRVLGEDGQPLEGAAVMVTTMGGNRDANRSGSTDEDGNFKLQNLPAAAYIVMAAVPGYVSPQSRLDLMTTHTSQRHRIGDNLTLTLVKGGVITGKVLDATGQPLVGAPVMVARVRDAEGRPINESIMTGRPGQTDDRGVYRLYGLQAGSYVVYTNGAGEQFSLMMGAREVPTYYPTSTRDTAQEVVVAAGGEVRGIDIRHRGEPGHAVSGTVVGAVDAGTGQGQIGVELLLAGTNNRAGTAMIISPSNNGFALYGVPDGEYDLTAIQRILNRSPQMTMDSLVSAPRRVTVRGGDVTGIELRVVALGSIAGRVVVEKLEKTDCPITRRGDLEELLLLPRREDKEVRRGSLAFFSQDVTPNEQGEFMVRELEAGRYRLTPQLPSDHWYLKAMTSAPATPARPAPTRTTATKAPVSSLATTGVTLKGGEKISGVTITLAEGAAGLNGHIEGKKPAARMRIFIVPAEKEAADDVLRYYEFVTRDGAFSFTNLAPGKYWLHMRAVPDDESDEKPAKPVAWDAGERAKLRRETEAANQTIELTACQRVKDFVLKVGK